MKKNYFTYLMCSMIALSSNSVQAVLDPIGLECYRKYGQKLRQLAESVLCKDGYTVNWEPIGAGYNGVVFKAIHTSGKTVAVKLSSSGPSSILMTRSSAWKPYFPSSYHYNYLGELEIARRWVNLKTYNNAIYDASLNMKKYQKVFLGDGLPTIHALYRFFNLDKPESLDWSIIIVTDWIKGTDLEEYSKDNKFDDSNVLDWILKILNALKPLHDAGWYHRDLNASNIMIEENGSICVIDFGKALDYYDKNHDTIPPWHNPDLIAYRDCDPDLAEIRKLVKGQLYASTNYQRNNNDLCNKIISALDESDNCKILYEKLFKLKLCEKII